MEIRLVFCKVHYEEFVKMAKMEVKT
jgi:hypothetical protein